MRITKRFPVHSYIMIATDININWHRFLRVLDVKRLDVTKSGVKSLQAPRRWIKRGSGWDYWRCALWCTNDAGFLALISSGTVSNPSLVISGALSWPGAQMAGSISGARSLRVFMIQIPREWQFDELMPNVSSFSHSVSGALRGSRSYTHSRFFWEHRAHFGFWTTHFRFEAVQFAQALRRVDIVGNVATREIVKESSSF